MIPEVTIRKAEPQDRADIEVLMSTCFHGIEVSQWRISGLLL
ncbi:hypothetical protein [Methanolobus sp. ZRKC5]